MNRFKLVVLAVFAVLTLSFVAFGFTASGVENANAAGNGAAVFHDSQTYDLGGGYAVTISVHLVFQVTFTPSGGLNINGNFRDLYQFVAPNGDILYEFRTSGQSTDHWKDGAQHVFAQHYNAEESIGGVTCRYESDFHIVDGFPQFAGSTFVCS